MSKTTKATFRHVNLFDPETIKKSSTISWKERLRILFHRSRYSLDYHGKTTTYTKYKIMSGKYYVLNVYRKNGN